MQEQTKRRKAKGQLATELPREMNGVAPTREQPVAGPTKEMNVRHTDTRRMRGQEIETMRGERSKTFALGRGMYQTVMYPERVHYRDQKGGWREIDNRLRPVGGECGEGPALMENITGPLRIRLGVWADADPLVSIQSEQGHLIRWRLEGASNVDGRQEEVWAEGGDEDENRAHADKSASKVRYAGALPHTDLICELRGDGLKEALILNGPEAPDCFQCTIDIGELAWEETGEGGLRLWDRANPDEDVFLLPPPFMTDAAGMEGKVLTEWEARDGSFVMTMTPDAEFLWSAQYPVTIDPTVQSGQSIDKTSDTFISEANKTTNYGTEETLRVGKHEGYGECKALVKISDLPALSSAYTITKAWMVVAALPTKDNKADAYLYAHEALGTWAPGTVKWDNKPACDEKHLDCALIRKGETEAKSAQLDITNLVRKWYANKAENYGVLLDTHEGQPITLCASENKAYTASVRPVIHVNYVSKAGLEGHLAYESFNAGRAGTAHVALHSGHLVVTRGLTAMNGNRMPISLGLTWNACAKDKNTFGVGMGWRLNWNQNLRREKPGTGDFYYMLTDEDGTEHEFRKHEKTAAEKADTAFVDYYEDRSGLSLKLYEGSSEAEIVSKDHSKLVFDKPTVDYTAANNAIKMIKRAEDAHGNIATFTYNASLQLTKVTDGAGRVTTLAYTENGVKITPPGYTTQVMLTLDANQRMTKVTDLDGQWSEYEYVGGTDAAKNRLILLRNAVDGCQIEPTYDKSGRVILVTAPAVVNGTRTNGNARKYEYFDCVTQVKDLTVSDGKVLTYQFNDYGNVVAVHDELGFAAFAKFRNTGKPNTPEAVSKLQRLVVNLLNAHDFTAGSGWKTGVISADGVTQESGASTEAGVKPMRLEVPPPGGAAYAEYRKDCEKGEYTFSVNVQSKGDALVWAKVIWQDKGGVWHTKTSERVRRVGSPQRLSCTFNLPEATLIRCRVLAGEGDGCIWFGQAQLERGALANRHNLLHNANFTAMKTGGLPEGWLVGEGSVEPVTNVKIVAAEASANKPKDLGANCLWMRGTPGKKTEVYQELDIQGEKDDNYVVGGWSRAWAAPSGENRTFRLRVRFQKKNGIWADGGTADWNEEWVDWQYACGAVVAPTAYRKMRVCIEYDENLNEAQIGVMSLTKEYYGQNFAYDEKNNVTAVSTLLGQKDKAEYDKWDNITSYVQPGRNAGDKYTFFYGSTDAEKKRHLVQKSETPLGMISETEYDAFGNATRSVQRNKKDARFVRTQTTYTADGNYAASVTDALGKITRTNIDPNKGLTLSSTDAAGQTVNYQYDAANRVTNAQTTVDGKTYRNAYTYAKDRLATVSHNTTGSTPDVTYTFGTDALGNQTTVKVGTRTLSTNVYTSTGDKLLTRVEYGNGGKVHYTYDSFKRTTGIRYDDATEPRFTYEYGANGAVGRVKDTELKREARMAYDLAERPVEAELYEGDALQYRLSQEYDRFEQPSVLHERVEEPDDTRSEYTISAEYDKESKPTTLTYESARMTKLGEPDEKSKRRLTYTYDGLGRITKRGFHADAGSATPTMQSQYTYATGGYGAESATARVQAIQHTGSKHEYWYDTMGNITRERWQGKAIIEGEKSIVSCGVSFEGQPLTTEANEPLSADVETTVWPPIPLEFRETQNILYGISFEEKFLTTEADEPLMAEAGEIMGLPLSSEGGEPLTLDFENLGAQYNTTYAYDALGQLVRVNDEREQATWTYRYDQGGNILEKKRYAYTTVADLSGLALEKTIPYAYGDANWKDKLTAYDGKTITYDAIGNPLAYDGWKYTWKAGRMLHSMVKSGVNATFTYDHTGLRVKKSVNGVDTLYTMNGKRVTYIRKGLNGATGPDAIQMHFFYDAQGRPVIVQYNGTDYAYLHNLQGDVTGIIDMNGKLVVQYVYDAWGKPMVTEGSMAETLGKDNPFRYRGYVWDEETGLYATATRCYDPEWGRWLNADEELGRVSLLHSHNLFAYCINQPVMLIDSSGREPVGHDGSMLSAVPQLSEADHHALTEAGGYIPASYMLIDAHDVDKYTRSVTIRGQRYKPAKYVGNSKIRLDDAYDVYTEYTYVYRREYDSTHRSRYEAMRTNNPALFDAIGALDISNIPALAGVSMAFDAAKTVSYNIWDYVVKLLPLPEDPNKILYEKVSKSKKVTKIPKVSRWRQQLRGGAKVCIM